MVKVQLNVYDITNSPDQKTNENIQRINRIAKDTLGLGGIFHGAIEVLGKEWSFGYCEHGSGVFDCTPKGNPMYTFRETIDQGESPLDPATVKQIIQQLSQEWDGLSYDLLAHNCNHFCDELSRQLGTGPIPAWVNRFANTGDAALIFYDRTSTQLAEMRASLVSTSRSAYSYLFPPPQPSPASVVPLPDPPSSPSPLSSSYDPKLPPSDQPIIHPHTSNVYSTAWSWSWFGAPSDAAAPPAAPAAAASSNGEVLGSGGEDAGSGSESVIGAGQKQRAALPVFASLPQRDSPEERGTQY